MDTETNAGRPADTQPTARASESGTEPVAAGTELVEDELLVEEISIDGMCGVY